MNSVIKSFTSLLIMSPIIGTSQSAQIKDISWQNAAYLENPDGSKSIGFAGPINGISNNMLIVAGGANFQDKMPWEGGKKQYSDEIHVLQKKGNIYQWIKNNMVKLPEPIAYCGVTSTNFGVVYVGGENEKGLSDKAYLIQWNANSCVVSVESLPNLPKPLTNIGLTTTKNIVYAVGGDLSTISSDLIFSLDLSKKDKDWKVESILPVALANAVVLAVDTPDESALYVIGGRTKTPSGISVLRSSTYKLNLVSKEWTKCADISDSNGITTFSAGAGVVYKDQKIILVGGDNGHTFHKIETFLSQIAAATSDEEKQQLIAQKNLLNTNHNGFYKGVLEYDTLKNQWSTLPELPFLSQVTTTALLWEDAIVLSNGEIKPGVRTPNIMIGTITP